MKKIIVLLLVVCGAENIIAQYSDNDNRAKKQFISAYSISFNSSWFKPSMNYWNNTFLPSAGSSEKFDGNIVNGGVITFGLPLNLGLRAGVWYMQSTVNGGHGATFSSLQIASTSISGGALYRYPKQLIWGLSPYAGVDVCSFYVQNKYDVDGYVNKMRGHDVAAAPFLGFDRVFMRDMVVGLEFGYIIGNYKQNVESVDGFSVPQVSISGLKFGITIGYKFL